MKNNKTKVLSAKVTTEQYSDWQDYAKFNNTTLSNFLSGVVTNVEEEELLKAYNEVKLPTEIIDFKEGVIYKSLYVALDNRFRETMSKDEIEKISNKLYKFCIPML